VSSENPDHTKQLHRINRIIGQLEGVKRMMEDRRYCPEILTQTRAVSSAVRSLEANILQGHLESCVRKAFESGKKDSEAKIEELVDLFRKAR
jgi:DNA-binding FrmR family transcriptional regulator